MPVPAAAPGPAVGAVDPDMEMLKLPMEMNDATLYTIRFGGHSTSFLRTVSFSNPVSPMPSSIPPAIPPMPLPSTPTPARTSSSTPHTKQDKREAGYRKEIARLRAELSEVRAEASQLRRAASAAQGDAATRIQSIQENKIDELRKERHFAKKAKEEKVQVMVDAKKEANMYEHTISKLQKANITVKGRLQKQTELVNVKRDEIKAILSTKVDASVVEQLQEQYDDLKTTKRDLETQVEESEAQVEELTERVAELSAGPGSGQFAEANALAHLNAMKEEVGVLSKYTSVPARQSNSDDVNRLSVRHMTAVLRGRGEAEDINLVATALHGAGYLERLLKADRLQPMIKQVVKDALNATQDHWSARHAVHVWDRLELSRSQMETLSHLLSYKYEPIEDRYERIVAWEHPRDSSDFLLTPVLAGRVQREKMYAEIVLEMNISVGENGRCERDATECASLLYTKYYKALRKDYSTARPAQPILFLDGTGGPLGKGICHGELGCADFMAVGDSDAKQSRATLQPLFLYTGNDHAAPLRENIQFSIGTYNKLVATGSFDRKIEGKEVEKIPARPITAADMQGAKSTYGMRECSHSVWCKCQRGEGGPHHRYPTRTMATYEEMIKYIEEDVGCFIKTFDEMCSWAHFSPGVAMGGAFTRFECSCCGYKPSEKQWRADMAKWNNMSNAERAEENAEHRGDGDELNNNYKHYHQELFMPPLPHHGMDRCGVDNLHLTHLNTFKHLFRYTVHEGLPESKKKLIAAYCKNANFYSYDAASLDVGPSQPLDWS